MNKIFKVVLEQIKNCYVVVSELLLKTIAVKESYL